MHLFLRCQVDYVKKINPILQQSFNSVSRTTQGPPKATLFSTQFYQTVVLSASDVEALPGPDLIKTRPTACASKYSSHPTFNVSPIIKRMAVSWSPMAANVKAALVAFDWYLSI